MQRRHKGSSKIRSPTIIHTVTPPQAPYNNNQYLMNVHFYFEDFVNKRIELNTFGSMTILFSKKEETDVNVKQ